jgi:DNA-binding MarR family transcriptional regulator
MDQVSSGRCQELLNLLRKITQAVDLHSKYLNKHFGLTGPQLGILQELSGGEKTVSELARAISLSQGTVTDIIHRLENKNLIVRRRGDRDKRQVLVALSERCNDLLPMAPPPLQETFMNHFSQIEEWEQLMILSAMNRVVKMMAMQPADAASQPADDSLPERRRAASG